MDAKMSCLLKGLIGVIFGGLALVVPEPLLNFFLGIFWIALITGLVLCVLIAITSSPEESFFWFICSAGFLLAGVVSAIFPKIISLLFVLAIAVLAFYAGYSGITFALTKPRSKYYLIAGVIVCSIALLYVFIRYVPSMSGNLIMTVVGTISLVFGLFAVVMGLTVKQDVPVLPPPHVLIFKTCKFPLKSPDTPPAGEGASSGDQTEKQPPQ
jgi:uncharacterized membrane protein HdeD (DUF308 family)